MFRLRSKSGDESVFRTPEEIRSALLSGFITPDAQIWDTELKGWVPLVEHALYQQIAAAPGGRKSGSVKAPPTGPGTPKAPPKLVIKRPGATTAIPAAKVPPATPPAAPPKPAAPAPPPVSTPAGDEIPDLELIDLDLTPEPEPAPASPAPPPAPAPPTPAPAAPPSARRPTPPPAPTPAAAEATSAPARRVSAPIEPRSAPSEAPVEEEPKSGSKLGLVIAAVVVLAVAGGGFVMFRGRGAATPAAADTTPAPVVHVAAADTTPDSTTVAATDTTRHDTTTAPAAVATAPATPPADTTHPATRPAAGTPPDTATAATGGAEAVPFAPIVDRGPAAWNTRPAPGQPLSLPALEAVRSKYVAAQARAAQQFEASLEVAEFADMFDPAKAARPDKRQAAFDAIDAARGALRDYRRKQAALDFAYTDSLRRALPPGSDDPDLRTFGPILRETPAQAALTDSLVSTLVDMYGLLINEAGGYTLKGGSIAWKDADNAAQYRADQERLTAQLARLRTRSPYDIPPAMAGILRGIGLPR